jgi:branched-chain amino acid transport system substrate-binding protein
MQRRARHGRNNCFFGICVAFLVLFGSFVIPSAGPAGAASGATGSPLHIGVITDSQTPCVLAGALNVVENSLNTWRKYVNSQGGIAGHPVDFTILNTGCNPGVAVSDAKQLVSDHVIAIIDNSSLDNDYASVVDAAKIPVICGQSSGSGIYCSSDANFFPTGTTEIPGAYLLMVAAKKAGADHFGFLYCTEVSTCGAAVPFLASVAKEVGLKYNAFGASETAPSYTAQCLAMQTAGVKALFVGGPPTLTVAQDCTSQHYNPTYIAAGATWSAKYLNEPSLKNATGDTGDVPWTLDNTPVTKTFQKVEGHILASSGYPYEVSGSYAAGLLLQTALAHLPANPTSQDVTDGLYAVSGTTLGGFSPPLDFVQGKATTVGCGFIVGIKNGRWSAPFGGKYFCQPKITP